MPKPKPLQTPDESRIPFAPFFLSFSLSAFSFPLAFSLLGFSLLLAVCWHMWLFESHVASSLWSFSLLFSFLFSLPLFPHKLRSLIEGARASCDGFCDSAEAPEVARELLMEARRVNAAAKRAKRVDRVAKKKRQDKKT